MRKSQAGIRTLFAALSMVALGYGHITLTAPSGGEVVQGGDSFTVKWTADDHDCVYNVYFSPDSGKTWQNIVLGLPKASRQHSWATPNQSTSKGMIRVFQDNKTGSDLEGKSKIFTVQGTTGIRNAMVAAGNATLRIQSGSVNVAFEVAQTAHVVLQGFNARGQLEATLTEGLREAGTHRLSFISNHSLSSGPLVFKLMIGDQVQFFNPSSAY